jgi:hypothetical protein
MPSNWRIEVSGDVKGVVRMPGHIKFAAAKALNDTGKFATDEVRRELDDELIIRGNWTKAKTRFGINIANATFSDPIPEAVVFTRADWLLEEEGYKGGVKVPESGTHLADPEDENTRGNIRRKFPVPQKAFVLLAQGPGNFLRADRRPGRGFRGAKGAFKIRSKKSGLELILQRVGTKDGEAKLSKKGIPLRGRISGGNSKLILKHVLKKRVKVPRTMILQKTTENTYRVWYGTYFGRNILLAFNTAK